VILLGKAEAIGHDMKVGGTSPNMSALSVRGVSRGAATGPRLSQVAAVLIAALYLIFLPNGLIGPIATAAAVALACIGSSSPTLVAASLLLAPYVFRALLQLLNLPSFGTGIAAAIGVLLLMSWPAVRRREVFSLPGAAVAWLAVVGAVLLTAYFTGPQTEYALAKLTGFVLGTAAATVAGSVLIRARRTSLSDLAIIASVASICSLSVLFYMMPSVRPHSILTLGGVRLAGMASMPGEDFVGARPVTQLAGWSIAMILGTATTLKRTGTRFAQLFLMMSAALVSLVAVNSAGQRAALVALLLAAFAVAASRSGRNRTTIGVAGCAALLLVGLAADGMAHKNPLLNQIFNDRASTSDRINRSTNWTAAIRRISEEPLFGHGIGGYYIDGISLPGSEAYAQNSFSTYPHNVFLELLVETGILGTLLIVGPVVMAGLRSRRGISPFSMQSGESLLPLAVYCLCIANITYDLRGSSVVFGLCVALWPRIRKRGATRIGPLPELSTRMTRNLAPTTQQTIN